MWRSATLAMVVSSTSMKVAIETTTAISQGLCPPAAERSGDQRPADRQRAVIAPGQGTTDMPGPTGMIVPASRRTTILTGTRCTTLT